MSQISATDANRNFSKLLRQVENGERVTITKDGKPVAVIAPAADDGGAMERAAAVKRLMATLKKGLAIGYAGPLNRDELHRRRP